MELPYAFIASTRALLGSSEFERFEAALLLPAPVSVRINPAKKTRLKAVGNQLADGVPWSETGFYLPARPAFTFDPLLHAGLYYVQEASSMFVGHVLRHILTEGSMRMLDLCAAPGGKSTLYRSLLPAGSLLVANEPIRQRVQVLAENLQKWGNPETVVTCNYPEDFSPLTGFFDVIAADVPCSGEGMFRKDAQSVTEWSEENVRLCSERQRKIVKDVWTALRPGGYLIYSTCTYNTQENEENVLWIARELGADVLSVPVEEGWQVTGSLLSSAAQLPVYRFLPHRTRGEGFFCALLRKHDNAEATATSLVRKPVKSRVGGNSKTVPAICKDWLMQTEAYDWTEDKGIVRAFPLAHGETLGELYRHLRVVSAGVAVAEKKGKGWQPLHALALSSACAEQVFPEAVLTYEQAVSYLRGEAVVLSSDVPCGYVLMTYRGLFLGLAKNLGNRANNLYPDSWRIRSGHLPPEVPAVF